MSIVIKNQSLLMAGTQFLILLAILALAACEYYNAAEVRKAQKALSAEKEQQTRSANPGREKGAFKVLSSILNRSRDDWERSQRPREQSKLQKIFQINREEKAANDPMMNDIQGAQGALAITERTFPFENDTDSLRRKMLELRPNGSLYEAINKHTLVAQMRGVFCNFENTSSSLNYDETCLWEWNSTKSAQGLGFSVVTAAEIQRMNVSRGYKLSGPRNDSEGKKHGHFLYLPVDPYMESVVMIQSPPFPGLWEFCKIEVGLHQYLMQNASIRLISHFTVTDMQVVLLEFAGNNFDAWQDLKFTIGKVQQPVRVSIEISRPGVFSTEQVLPHIAIDNIRMVDCLPDPPNKGTGDCEEGQHKCKIMNSVSCIRLQQVCDLVKDCDDGSDENKSCDKMPYGSYCNFERDECGFHNLKMPILRWSRHSGPTPTDKTGPNYDHTCGEPKDVDQADTPTMIPLLTPAHMNHTLTQCVGYYYYVNMNSTGPNEQKADFASTAAMRTVTFNPPPKVHGNLTSKYYNSCMIRFYYQQNGRNFGSLGVDLVEITSRGNNSIPLWFSTKNKGEHWYRAAIFLPNITRRYYLVFRSRMGMRIYSDSAIDDFSMAPECFGLNIDKNELGDYNYYEPQINDNTTVHYGFVNRTVYRFTPCGAVGPLGPTQAQCDTYYGTHIVKVLPPPLAGVQAWTVPEDNTYTIIATGAGGGYGSAWAGYSHGAVVRTVAYLRKGEVLYMMIGQRGLDACKKTLSAQESAECSKRVTNGTTHYTSKTHEVFNTAVTDGGGGGGGGTFVFMMDRHMNPRPLVIAGGGGGISVGIFRDDGSQLGKGLSNATADSGYMLPGRGRQPGGGGGWTASPGGAGAAGGGALSGGAGGRGCGGRAHGGYGGGGGGCVRGGAGGGWIGGSVNEGEHGGGGYSHVAPERTDGAFTAVMPYSHNTNGEVLIIPAVKDCGCYYRCLAMNEYLSDVKCFCPSSWKIMNETMCISDNDYWPELSWYVVTVLGAVVLLCIILMLCACLYAYNRYQRKKEADHRRKQLLEQEMQLQRLRNPPGENALGAFNLHYGADAMLTGMDSKTLPQVPREGIKLLKPLGQGAFGEVFQGIYTYRGATSGEMPVAVKTLPETSARQEADDDFIMEAAIMAKFNHPNIVHLIGVCFTDHPRFIVLELLAGGDLKVFLRESRPRPERASALTMKDLLHCALDVCKGCRYLEAQRFIHRDIAARNCLLTSRGPGRVAKIADFGMARDIYRADYYKKGGKAMLPIKWMPPEAFLDGLFTTKTDVWSFGVLLWEVFSLGIMPYTGCSNQEVMQMVSNGGRLEKPYGCPQELYRIMCECWNPTPEARPSFANMFDKLIVFSQDPQITTAPLPVVRSLFQPLDGKGDNGTQRAPACDYLVPLTPSSGPDPHSSTDQLIPHSTLQTAPPPLPQDDSPYPLPPKVSLVYGSTQGGVRGGGVTSSASEGRTNKFLQSSSTDRLLSSAEEPSVDSGSEPRSPVIWETSFIETPDKDTPEAGPVIDKLISITPTSPQPPENALSLPMDTNKKDSINKDSNKKDSIKKDSNKKHTSKKDPMKKLKQDLKQAPLASPDPPRIKPWNEAPKLPAKPKPLCLDAAQLEQNLNALKKNSGSVNLNTMNILPPYINVVTPNKLSESKTIQIDPKKAVFDLQSPNDDDKEEVKLKQSKSAASLLNGPMTDVPFVDSDHTSSSSGSNPPNNIKNIKKSKPNNYSEVKIGKKLSKKVSNGDGPDSEISC